MKKVTVLGLGNFGYAVLKHLDKKNGPHIQLTGYSRNAKVVTLLQGGSNHPLFPQVSPLLSHVTLVSTLKEAVQNADYLIFAVSSVAYTEVVTQVRDYLRKPVVIINTAKALDHRTGDPFSQVTADILYDKKYTYSVLVGATIAQDLAAGIPLGINVASEDARALNKLVQLFNSKNLTVIPTIDLIGAEYAAAFKNVISIFSGIIHGLGYALETEIFAMTHAAAEVERMVINEFGGKRETFILSSPCWGNDLWMSCTSRTRNRELGILLGQGNPVEQVLMEMELQHKTTEGVFTIRVMNKITNLKRYPSLHFLYKFFNNQASLNDVKLLIENNPA